MQQSIILVAIRNVAFALEYDIQPGTKCEKYEVGMRVEVPYRNKKVVGVVVQTNAQAQVCATKRKAVISKIDSSSLLRGSTKAFLQAVQQYYVASMAQIIHNSFCKKSLNQDGLHSVWTKSYTLNQEVLVNHVVRAPVKKLLTWAGKRQQFSVAEAIRAKFKEEVIHEAECAGYLKISSEYSKKTSVSTTSSFAPSEAQQAVIQSISENKQGYNYHYLHGVTGSGKTAIYTTVCQAWLAEGGQVLWLVPEIGLTPQLLQAVYKCCHEDEVACYHSGLSERERYFTWLDATCGRAKVVIGTRSSVFLPFANLRGIIIDEEHDASYKQQNAMRYSTRGVACMRAKAENIPILLGSATPSLACLYRKKRNEATHYTLMKRFGGVELPNILFTDMQKKVSAVGLSHSLMAPITETLNSGKQVLIFLNRRGYAPCWWCQSCSSIQKCDGCDRPLTYHHTKERLACHRCARSYPVTRKCSVCGEESCVPLGMGTEKISKYLAEKYPDTEIVQVDRDTCSTWGKLQETIKRLHTDKPQLIVATQMVVKSHHIANLHMVVVMDVDHALQSNDFRALEHMQQQIHQVVGRAGREKTQGVVHIQTAYPEHPLWRYIKRHDYLGGASYLLKEREEIGLPPYSYQAVFCIRHKQQKKAETLMHIVWRDLMEKRLHGKVYRPMPAQYAKLQDTYSYILLLQAPKSASLRRDIVSLQSLLETYLWSKSVAYFIDIDPLEY